MGNETWGYDNRFSQDCWCYTESPRSYVDPDNGHKGSLEGKGYHPRVGRQNGRSDVMQLSKKSNWVEKSQDMYNFEQKPIGRDRKEVEGEFPKSIPNTWTEIK